MKAYKDKKLICDIPDNMSINDTIIDDIKTFVIISKTWDNRNKELYCKVNELNNDIPLDKILTEIYKSEYFLTSGSNTNNIKGNPRTVILLTIAGLIIEPEFFDKHYKSYQDTIIIKWNDKKISWSSIFGDPPIHLSNLAAIKLTAAKLLSELKIDKNLWPDLES